MLRPPVDRPRVTALALALALVVAASACSTDLETDEMVPPEDVVTVFGPWIGASADTFRAAVAPFEERTGIEVRYTGSGSFDTDIVDRAADGHVPDVAIFPQPGLIDEMADAGFVLPIPEDLAEIALSTYLPAIAEQLGDAVALPYRLNVKSLVWYPPSVFAAEGYEVPLSMDQLDELITTMIIDGHTPWCMGVEAFTGSGWPATDWVEDIVLRQSGTEVYDAWAEGVVPFTDDAVVQAVAMYGDLTLQPGQTFGGRRGILNTLTTRAQDPMFEDPPRCLMHRQASFQIGSLPEGTTVGPNEDTDVFIFPGTDPAHDPPLLAGGDLAAGMTDRDATWRLMEYLATPEAGEAWAKQGGYISPHAAFGQDQYANPFDARMASLLADADVIRFDGSDLMPPAVGFDTFREAMLMYISNGRLASAMEHAQSGYED